LVAQYLLFLLGLAVKAAGRHRRYQANSIKNRNVLSNQFIGLRAYKDKLLKLLKKHWKAAMDEMNSLIAEPHASFCEIRGDPSGSAPFNYPFNLLFSCRL
jgi:hypothetical protein